MFILGDGYGRACGCTAIDKTAYLKKHVAAPPAMHTCVRSHAPTMRPSPSRARVGVRPPGYIANADVMYNICMYTYIDAKSSYVNGYACVPCVRSRAGADDVLIRGMCASATRSLCSAIDGTRTGVVCRYMMHPCARVCACAIVRPSIRAEACERVPSA